MITRSTSVIPDMKMGASAVTATHLLIVCRQLTINAVTASTDVTRK